MPQYPRTPFKKVGTSIKPRVATDHLVLPQVDDVVTPTLAFGDGDTGLFEGADDAIYIAVAEAYKWLFNDSFFGSANNNGGSFLQPAATATIPSVVPDRSDANTGLGHAADDQLSLIAGGVEGIRITENGGPIYATFMGGQSVHKTDAGAANYNPSILTSDYIITTDTTAAARAVTISTEDRDSGTSANPRIFIIKDIAGNAGANNITVSLETAGTIDGAATAVISGDYNSITLIIDGTNGSII